MTDQMSNREISIRAALRDAVNSVSAENGSDTPDFVLGAFLARCLDAFDRGVVARADWHKDAALSASPVDLDAVRREAAREALTSLCQSCIHPEFWTKPDKPLFRSEDASKLHKLASEFSDRYLAKEYPAPAPDRVELTCVVCGLADKGVLPFAAPTGEPAHAGLSVCVGALGAALAARVGGQP